MSALEGLGPVLNSQQLWKGLPKRRARTDLRASADLRSTSRSRLLSVVPASWQCSPRSAAPRRAMSRLVSPGLMVANASRLSLAFGLPTSAFAVLMVERTSPRIRATPLSANDVHVFASLATPQRDH